MDWGKIKALFIYLFVVLNIVLLSFYIYTVYKNKTEIVQEKEIIENSMKNDNIILEESTTKKENFGYVNVTISNFRNVRKDNSNLNYEIEDNSKASILKINSDTVITNINKNNYKVEIDNFLLEKVKPGVSYVFSSYNEDKKQVIYEQVIDGIRIFDNKNARIVFSVESNGDIKYFEQTAVVNARKDKNETLTGQLQAVTRVYHEDLIPKNSRVTATLGYYTYISQTENQVLIPTWNVEIRTNDGNSIKNYYVDAINLNILNRK